MKKRILGLLVLISCLLSLSGCGVTQTSSSENSQYEGTIETARTEIWRSITSGNVSSASVAIMKDSEIVYQESFGMANRLTSQQVDSETQYNIGSVSKVFTTVAVLQLVEEGLVNLDEPVTTYINDFTMLDDRYQQITVRMLMNHASGLPGTFLYNGFASADDPDFLTKFMNYLKQSTLKSDPGSVSVYCNDGFMLAEVLIERVSGQPYADYLQAHVFDVADMGKTSCSFMPDNDNIALNYSEDGLANPVEIVNLMGTGGLTSTASDLCRFGQALLNNTLISEESFLMMSEAQYGSATVPQGIPITDYGLGWDMVEVADFVNQGLTVHSKNGSTFQYSSQFYLIPEQNLVIALTYSGNKDVTPVTNSITEAFLRDTNVISTDTELTNVGTGLSVIPADVLQNTGIYGGNGIIWRVRFDLTNNQLIIDEYLEGDFVETQAMSYYDDGYFHNDAGMRYSFYDGPDQTLIVMTLPDVERHLVVAETLSSGSISDVGNFSDSWWIPANLSATDLNAEATYTDSFDQIPGLIVVDGGTIYALRDNMNSQMILEYARDLTDLSISLKNGAAMLSAYGYQYINAAAIDVLANSEDITIADDDTSMSRRINNNCVLQITMPESGRVVIYSPDYSIDYDSLYETQESVDVEAGSILLLTGKANDEFNVKVIN
ncbi:serine hydrolase domain-containing protein [Eubacteriaceae bacterium ES3]|nr:serine hydrolase domain-containing protein [Eubacteriaceae bacterium ES3]